MAIVQNSNTPRATSIGLPPDLVPNEDRRRKLELDIEACLHSLVDEAKQKSNGVLDRARVTPEERRHLTADHLAVIRRFLPLAEKKLRILFRWEQQRIYGERADSTWSESTIREQRAVSDRREEEMENKPLPFLPRQLRPPVPTRPKPESFPESIIPISPFHCKPEYHHLKEAPLSRTARKVHTGRASSILNKPHLVKSTPGGQVQALGTHTVAHEVWKPSITREEDAQMSRTFTLVRRGGTAKASSSFKATSVLSGALSGLLRPLSGNMDDEHVDTRSGSSTTSATSPFRAPPVLSPVFSDSPDALLNMDQCATIHSADQEWSILCTSPKPKRKRESAEYAHERATKFWPHERQEDSSHSPQTSEDSWFWSQDMEYYFEEQSHDSFKEHGLEDASDMRGRRSWGDHQQQIEGGLHDGQDAANRHELARKAEELKRLKADEEAKHKEEELRRKEEEVNRKETETVQRQEEVRRKEEEANRKEEEARKKKEEAEEKEKEARKREMETKRKEEEVLKKEREIKSREREVIRKAEAARQKEEVVRKMEEEARYKEHEVKQKQEEAQRKEEEAHRSMEEINIKVQETRRKEDELRERERKLRHREEDLNRREVEMRCKEEEERPYQGAEEGKNWFQYWRRKGSVRNRTKTK